MKRKTHSKYHKYLGLPLALLLVLMSLSGIILNHRNAVADWDISRTILPQAYQFKNWNNGLLRGTLHPRYSPNKQTPILLYGRGGIWHTDSQAQTCLDYNQGLPKGAEHRDIRAVGENTQGRLFAINQMHLYTRTPHTHWKRIELPKDADQRLSDLTLRADTLVIVGRSHLYLSTPPYKHLQEITLPPAPQYDSRPTLLRYLWLLHSGEIFGTPGKLFVDALAVVLLYLCLSGLLLWLLRKKTAMRTLRNMHLRLHDQLGLYLLFPLLLLTITGMMLRPPLLLLVVKNKLKPLPLTSLKSDNPWQDQLRMLRWDETQKDWILVTSDKFFKLHEISSKNTQRKTTNQVSTQTPLLLSNTPPLNVMGCNVLYPLKGGLWAVGSFSGMFLWNRTEGTWVDYFTLRPTAPATGMPAIGGTAVSGFSTHLGKHPIVVDYNKGNKDVPQPAAFQKLPMSLWNLMLEIHTGRIFTILGKSTMIYVFLLGMLTLWLLHSGWKIRLKRGKKTLATNAKANKPDNQA